MLAHRTQIIERYESHQVGDIEFDFLGVIDLFEFDEVSMLLRSHDRCINVN